MTLKQLLEFSNVGERFLPFHDDTRDAVYWDFDRFNRSLADTFPVACAPASSWRADAEGSNSKSLGAQVASDGSFASIGCISAAME